MNREQFILLVEGTQKEYRRFLTALCCGDSQQADDIAQESYIKAYLSCDGLKDGEKFKAWLYRIGYTTFINSLRTRRPSMAVDEAQFVADRDSADKTFEYQELYSSLELLPSKERTAILLYYMEGYAIKEIAQITDSNDSAVKQLLSRGRVHLRNLLNKD